MATLVGMFKILMERMQSEGKNDVRAKIELDGIVYKLNREQDKLWVTDNVKYPDHTYYGMIRLNTGIYHPRHDTSQQVIDKVIEHMSHPTDSIKSHGRKTGWCCMCGRMLVAKNSVRYAIGPICAGRWGIDLDSMAEEDDRKEQASIWDEL